MNHALIVGLVMHWLSTMMDTLTVLAVV